MKRMNSKFIILCLLVAVFSMSGCINREMDNDETTPTPASEYNSQFEGSVSELEFEDLESESQTTSESVQSFTNIVEEIAPTQQISQMPTPEPSVNISPAPTQPVDFSQNIDEGNMGSLEEG